MSLGMMSITLQGWGAPGKSLELGAVLSNARRSPSLYQRRGLIPSLPAETPGVQGLKTQCCWSGYLPGMAFGVKESCHSRMGAGSMKERTSPSLTIAGSSTALLPLPAPQQLISQCWHHTPATVGAT